MKNKNYQGLQKKIKDVENYLKNLLDDSVCKHKKKIPASALP